MIEEKPYVVELTRRSGFIVFLFFFFAVVVYILLVALLVPGSC